MSPGRWNPFVRRGQGKTVERPVDEAVVKAKADHLARAIELGAKAFPVDDIERTERLLTKIHERRGLGAGHTIVALAGATGSGKSSLFNALVGADVAQSGVTRPTTSRAGAATWGQTSHELLDWISVAGRHEVSPSAPGYAELEGLVLLDLPDLDSRVTTNRAEADRVLELCDVFVWVTDPQKYADALLHHEYVREFAQTRATSFVVLNQIDRLSPEAARQCLEDLVRLLVQDGMSDPRVVPASTVTPDGGHQVLECLADAVQSKNAADRRLAGDLTVQARRLSDYVGAERNSREPGVDAELVAALERAAGVPVVLDAVERDHRREAVARTGWPFTRWAQRARPRPLARLGLDRGRRSDGTTSETNVTLSRSSLPAPTPAARAAVELATRRLGDRAADGMPTAWADEVHRAVNTDDTGVADALDQAILATPLRGRRPAWWAAVGVLQWCFAAVALAGALWLAALAAFAAVQIHLEAPTLGSWLPIPLLMLVGGLAAGFLLAVLSRALANRSARRARRAAQARLETAIEQVARQRIVEPLAQIVRRHDECAQELARASA